MRLITEPSVTLIAWPTFREPEHLPVEWLEPLSDGECLVEYAGRLCYMSQHNPAEKTTRAYLHNVRTQGHGSIFEHAVYVLLLEGISRSCSHEIVRHRAGCGYSQLSQRYVDQSDLGFVVPPAYLDLGPDSNDVYQDFVKTCELEADAYGRLVQKHEAALAARGVPKPKRKSVREAARSVLGNAAETKLVMSGNIRAWRSILELRTSEGADREIRRLALMILKQMQEITTAFFDDFVVYADEQGIPAARCGHHKV